MVDQDKHMRFTRIVKTTCSLATLFPLGFVAIHAGCDVPLPPCPPGTEGPYDNREGQFNPDSDADYYCLKNSGPPQPPYLGQDHGHGVGEDGPRDLNITVNGAIIIESCIHDVLIPEFNINTRLDALYNTTMKSAVERAIAKRVIRLSSSQIGRGCDRVNRALGIAITPDDPRFAEGCAEGTAMRRRISPSGMVYNDWFYCPGLNVGTPNFSAYLECYSAPHARCDTSRKSCTVDAYPTCDFSPLTCEYSEEEGESFTYDDPAPCYPDAVCTLENGVAFCTGPGPACTTTFARPGAENVNLDFRAGIACENETTLRACINGHEGLIDCTKLGQSFKCIGGSQPHCGVDFQCDYEGSFPLPTCDGPFITVCNAGLPKTVDCRSLGFETCDPERGICK